MSFHPDSLVLTPDGWKPIHSVETTDLVAELDRDNLVFSHPLEKRARNFSGDLVIERARNHGFVVTPDHVLEGCTPRGHNRHRYLAGAPRQQSRLRLHTCAPLPPQDREVHDTTFSRLIGVIKSAKNKIGRQHIYIRPMSQKMFPYVLAVIRNAGVAFRCDGQKIYLHRHPRLLAYLSENGHIRRSTALALDEESKQTLLWSFIVWKYRNAGPSHKTVITITHEDDRELFMELGALSGMSVTADDKDHGPVIKVRPERWNGRSNNGPGLPYSGRVYDLAMPTGTLLTRFQYRYSFTLDGTATL